MDTIPKPRAVSQARSGGKILRGRRTAAPRTPYDRPSLPSLPPARSPNWLTGFVFPTTRMIANGAGKFLSTVFSTESTSSSSDGDSDSEHGMDDDSGSDIPSEGLDGVNERSRTSEVIKYPGKVPEQIIEKTETKLAIERLLMQETFSREECNRLIKIIKSRVVDCSTIKEGQDEKQTEISSYVPDSGSPDICIKAVREARKWLEEKRMISSPELDLNYGNYSSGSVRLHKATESEVGSPVDMAKSYMKVRPPWASPSKYIELKTPSPMMIEPFKEETLHLVGSSSLSSSMVQKRKSLATGSWNIHEEIRRVRSKATEDLLKTIPSTKIDLSSYALEPKTDLHNFLSNKAETLAVTKVQKLDSAIVTKPREESLDFSAGTRTSPGRDVQQDGSQSKALSSNPAIFTPEHSQQKELEGNQTVADGVDASKSYQSASLDLASGQYADDENGVKEKQAAELGGLSNANGFPSRQSSLCNVDKENRNEESSSHTKKGNSIPVEETCEMLSEPSVEIPSVDETVALKETDTIASSSPNSKNSAQPNSEPNLAEKTNDKLGKQYVKRPGRYSRRIRGRDK